MMRLSIAVLIICFGCADRPTAWPMRTWAQLCDNYFAGVENFTKVSPVLWRSSRPTAEGFRDLKATGVKTVESLREGKDDLPHLQGTKLSHVRIPTRTWNPEEAQLVLFLKILEDPKNWPVFVHCVEGRGYS